MIVTMLFVVPRVIHEISGSVAVRGVTSVDKKLFVLRERDKYQVEVYSTTDFNLLRQLTIVGFTVHIFTDMTSCRHNKCLYISDFQNTSIITLGLDGELICEWSVIDKSCGLSVTNDHNVLVSCIYTHKLREFTSQGKLVREVNLQPDSHCLSSPCCWTAYWPVCCRPMPWCCV